MGQPCTATSPLLLPINPRKTYILYSWRVVRSGYTRAKDDNQDPSLCLLHVLAVGVTGYY